MIGQASKVRYVHEPFNISGRSCHCGMKLDYWFHYLTSIERQCFQGHLQHIFFPDFNHIALLNFMTEAVRSRRIRPFLLYLQSYLPHRPLIKAPLAVFSAEILASLFDMDVIILIRHPAAVVNSYKKLNWSHPFSHFLNQPELMEEHLAPFRIEIEEFSKTADDIVDQTALLWKLIHSMIQKYQKSQTDWIFVRYEDLVTDPVDGYRRIFEQIELPFSDRNRRIILAHALQERLPNSADPYAVKQNPNQVLSKWKRDLTSTEINRIRKRVEEVSSAFYKDEDWNLNQ